jgi:hypothetical protein
MWMRNAKKIKRQAFLLAHLSLISPTPHKTLHPPCYVPLF